MELLWISGSLTLAWYWSLITSARSRRTPRVRWKLGDRAPAFVQHRDQFGVEGVRRQHVVPVGRLTAGGGHVLTELAVHGPIRLGGRTMVVLVAQVFKQPAADDLVDFRPFDGLPDLLDSAQHLLQRLVGPLRVLVHELGKLAGQRGDHDGVRAVGDGNGQLLEERERGALQRAFADLDAAGVDEVDQDFIEQDQAGAGLLKQLPQQGRARGRSSSRRSWRPAGRGVRRPAGRPSRPRRCGRWRRSGPCPRGRRRWPWECS